ncbi:hypothetical protein G6F42_026595 [Rhizopus arrhizus]|nr:hypothetical protein G6F42_026595 [Rhizopus arrhizus]
MLYRFVNWVEFHLFCVSLKLMIQIHGHFLLTQLDLREYATVALRNIMENNPENQKLIEELKPEQVVETEELKQMGIVPELTQDGKLRIKRP